MSMDPSSLTEDDVRAMKAEGSLGDYMRTLIAEGNERRKQAEAERKAAEKRERQSGH